MLPNGARDRRLRWEGCVNVRDLGGHKTADGHFTRRGAVVRSDTPDQLTAKGWQALHEHGIRTVVDLRDGSELGVAPPGVEVESVHIPVLDFEDAGFWAGLAESYDPASFYRSALDRWPDRFSAAVAAVARARPGGVLVHCQFGRDRTGLVIALLLALVNVPADMIAEDYALSAQMLEPLYEEELRAVEDGGLKEQLQRENATEATAMLEVLDGMDAAGYLIGGGATEEDLQAIRDRLLD